MKLNPDCIRDLLFAIESSDDPGGDTYFVFEDKYGLHEDQTADSPGLARNRFSALHKYTDDEIYYHLRQCEMDDLIGDITHYSNGSCLVADLTPKGHKFLADIRSDTNWNKTKEIAQKVGSTSLDAISKISSDVIAALIKSQF